MEAIPREVRYLQDADEYSPFKNWLARQTSDVRGLISIRLRKVSSGNLGDIKPVGGKVYELRFIEGPGWRVYIAQMPKVIYVLGGGMKRGQQGDIDAAIEFWSKNGDQIHIV